MLVVDEEEVRIKKLELGLWGTNAYILICKATMDSVVVDAPAEADKIIEQLKETKPKYILMTHSHMDHTGALLELEAKLKIPVASHLLDSKRLPITPQIILKDGDTVSFGRIKLKVLHTPGHTPGSLAFLVSRYLISGDTLFPGGPGKTASPTDLKQIIESITTKLFVLPDDTQVFPGHGNSTILKKEKDEFAVFSSRPHASNLCGDVLWLSS